MIDPNKKVPHKHAAVIKAWADGAEIESYRSFMGEWLSCEEPTWHPGARYRVKGPPHKWQKEMDAQAAGKVIQYRNKNDSSWIDGRSWRFNDEDAEYRIKPELVTQDVCICWLNSPHTHVVKVECGESYAQLRNVRLTFEDGKLIGAEVI